MGLVKQWHHFVSHVAECAFNTPSARLSTVVRGFRTGGRYFVRPR